MFEKEKSYPLIIIALSLALILHTFAFVWLALALIAILIIKPELLALPSGALERAGRFIGTALSSIVLSAIFFLFITPYGVLYRALIPKLREHFFVAIDKKSFFIQENRMYYPASFENPW